MLLRSACLPALLAGLLVLPACARAGSVTPAQASAAAVGSLLEANDCNGALDELKRGLKQGYAEVALLAGSMYELGVCVQRNWDHAVLLYAQAYQAGLKQAADRMAAGFAAPENGTDVVGALWWAGHGSMAASAGRTALGSCAPGLPARDDIDAFVAELKTWPQARLAMCNYVAGVMATLAAETRYPGRARAQGVSGAVVLRFLPAGPRIDVQAAHPGFKDMLDTLGARALARYPQPDGIPSEAEFLLQFVFELE